MARVIFAKIRLPIFSIKYPESFQIMSSMPVPQPSSLIGALAYCIGVSTGVGTRAYSSVIEMVSRGEILAARARPLEERAGTPLTLSPVVLRRFRIVDKAHETKKKGETKPIERLSSALARGDTAEAKRLLEVNLTDAFYREYAMGYDILCAWIVRGDAVRPEVLRLIQRLGDTESLCSVLDVWSESVEVFEDRVVETPFPAPAVEEARVLEGSFMYAKMCDEMRVLRPFIIPCTFRMERRRGMRYPTVRPSRVKIDYGRNVEACETSYGSIVLARG